MDSKFLGFIYTLSQENEDFNTVLLHLEPYIAITVKEMPGPLIVNILESASKISKNQKTSDFEKILLFNLSVKV